MREELAFLPPGRLWLPVDSLADALHALEVLRAHCIHCTAEGQPLDRDEI